MSSTRIILLAITVFACLLARTTCIIPYPDLDEETNCPLNVKHVCTTCAEDQNRYGCYCETKDGDVLVTANIFTRCPDDIADPCSNNSCINGATCVRKDLADYTCICASGFGGEICNETLPTCSGVKCPNAECVETADILAPVYCQCYDGTRRNPLKNETCPLSPCYDADTATPVCQNNATCQIFNNAYICECTPGWGGVNCSRALRTPLCQSAPTICGEGRCQQSIAPPYYSCNCGNHPYTFSQTLTGLVKCEASGCYATNPCQNGGTCTNKLNGGFSCQCSPRFTGFKCEKPSLCFTNPCLNNGICSLLNETTYFCNCPAPFTGVRCESAVPDPCRTKNCGLYGQCRDNKGVAVCFCNDGFHFNEAPCLDPCLNKSCGPGVCARRANATYQAVCSCPINRTGDSCEISRDVCRQSPRCGGGYCKPNYAAPRGYSCVCEGGRTQPDPCPFSKTCPIKDCGTQGICVETDGLIPVPGTRPIYYVCLCKEGYISSGSCDALLTTAVPAAASRCGPKGKPYPSRNPNNPIGCWCNNGTHIEEIAEVEPAEYCL